MKNFYQHDPYPSVAQIRQQWRDNIRNKLGWPNIPEGYRINYQTERIEAIDGLQQKPPPSPR